MLDDCSIKERWTGVDAMLRRWLDERQSILIDFVAVSEQSSGDTIDKDTLSRLAAFCELLMDYISAGHFEVYYQLVREAEAFDDGSAVAAKALLPLITSSTETILQFNDQYTDASTAVDAAKLCSDLSALGELLESRFEQEDRLIELMHIAHRDLIQQADTPAETAD